MELESVKLNAALNFLWPCPKMALFGHGAKAITLDWDMDLTNMYVNQLWLNAYVERRLFMWPLEHCIVWVSYTV